LDNHRSKNMNSNSFYVMFFLALIKVLVLVSISGCTQLHAEQTNKTGQNLASEEGNKSYEAFNQEFNVDITVAQKYCGVKYSAIDFIMEEDSYKYELEEYNFPLKSLEETKEIELGNLDYDDFANRNEFIKVYFAQIFNALYSQNYQAMNEYYVILDNFIMNHKDLYKVDSLNEEHNYEYYKRNIFWFNRYRILSIINYWFWEKEQSTKYVTKIHDFEKLFKEVLSHYPESFPIDITKFEEIEDLQLAALEFPELNPFIKFQIIYADIISEKNKSFRKNLATKFLSSYPKDINQYFSNIDESKSSFQKDLLQVMDMVSKVNFNLEQRKNLCHEIKSSYGDLIIQSFEASESLYKVSIVKKSIGKDITAEIQALNKIINLIYEKDNTGIRQILLKWVKKLNKHYNSYIKEAEAITPTPLN